MKIAIQAADLDAERIDGTRVYILNLLKYFGALDPDSEFLIYHKKKFNPELTPPIFPNYKIITKNFPKLWTQTRLALDLWKENPDVLWMPLHSIPIIRNKNLKTVVTIHDLAFKYFPETFPQKDIFKLNILTRLAVTNSDKIITISESTKKDILKFYPQVKEDKIQVISHGFDEDVFAQERNIEKEEEVKKKYKISGEYILSTGGLQPRKNLETLVESYGLAKAERIVSNKSESLKLVLVGENAWLSDSLFKKIENSPFKKDIILTGRVDFSDLGHLYRGAKIYVYPSLYDGFGITPLEAMAAKVPVLVANNSSLSEVCGQAALYFEAKNSEDLADQISKVLADDSLRQGLIDKGSKQIKKFSWEKCARETLKYLKAHNT